MLLFPFESFELTRLEDSIRRNTHRVRQVMGSVLPADPVEKRKTVVPCTIALDPYVVTTQVHIGCFSQPAQHQCRDKRQIRRRFPHEEHTKVSFSSHLPLAMAGGSTHSTIALWENWPYLS